MEQEYKYFLDVKGFVEVSGLSKDDFEKKVAKIQEFKNLSINLKTVANVTSKLNRIRVYRKQFNE